MGICQLHEDPNAHMLYEELSRFTSAFTGAANTCCPQELDRAAWRLIEPPFIVEETSEYKITRHSFGLSGRSHPFCNRSLVVNYLQSEIKSTKKAVYELNIEVLDTDDVQGFCSSIQYEPTQLIAEIVVHSRNTVSQETKTLSLNRQGDRWICEISSRFDSDFASTCRSEVASFASSYAFHVEAIRDLITDSLGNALEKP